MERFREFQAQYYDTLVKEIMPYWLTYALDESAALPVKEPFHLPRALIMMIGM